MAAVHDNNKQGGIIVRTWRRLRRPSAHWSVLALLFIGLIVGFVVTAGTQVMVAVTGTNDFCSGACHSMQWVGREYQTSVHAVNHSGVSAGCHDCHIPHDYPELLWYKAKAGAKDVIGEVRGVIATEDSFKKERLRMAQEVWEEYKANDSRNCRTCHQFTPAIVAKQKDFVQPMHQMVLQGQGTCIDCHKGVAHTAPSE